VALASFDVEEISWEVDGLELPFEKKYHPPARTTTIIMPMIRVFLFEEGWFFMLI
jgi:hypothetical protein